MSLGNIINHDTGFVIVDTHGVQITLAACHDWATEWSGAIITRQEAQQVIDALSEAITVADDTEQMMLDHTPAPNAPVAPWPPMDVSLATQWPRPANRVLT